MKTLLAAALASALATGGPGAGAPAVSVRIEGDRATLFEGAVTADAQTLDGGDGTGPHPCVGGRPDDPRSTAGTALAAAVAAAGTTWSGKWNADFRDFFVDRIGPDPSRPPTAYWAVLVNGRYAQGACREVVGPGDDVLWAFDTNARPLILALDGPSRARAGEPVAVTVRDAWVRGDGTGGGPVAGARVGGAVTDSAGRAVLRFSAPGPQMLKAEHDDGVRSNALHLSVEPAPPGSDPADPPGAVARTRIVEVAGGRRHRRVRGTIAPSAPAGSRLDVSLRGRIPGRRRCATWTRAARLRWAPCRRPPATRALRARPRWRLALPSRLPRGRYRITARVVDPAGRTEPLERGRNDVTFRAPRRMRTINARWRRGPW